MFEDLGASIPGDYCAHTCDSSPDSCPPTGTPGLAMCIVVLDMGGDPTHCAVLCDPQLRDPGCPPETSCKDVPDLQPPVGVCTAP
ncbi:hypothetical protein [Nannocystis punicea]|uniref:Uncharacterized protein n=1 Tax=Nannocystis punicea TaxID=2995304 RepID=A0ABY7HGB8_9BACT|nr:hypothetical protein [Nannocystis poenicansa]WAS98333.1 hypothetical protein O0S08_19505 [Nannocystis poenicansa]